MEERQTVEYNDMSYKAGYFREQRKIIIRKKLRTLKRGIYPNFRLKELWERKLPQLKEGHEEAMSLGKN